MITLPFKSIVARFPEYAGGETCLRVLDIGDTYFVSGIHGDEDGYLSVEILMDSCREDGGWAYFAEVSAEDLIELIRELVGQDKPLSICPCYPMAARERYGSLLTVMGDWAGSTHHFWAEDPDSITVQEWHGS